MMKKFITDRRGVTALEYGLVAALVAVVIIGTVTAVGTSLTSVFTAAANGLKLASS
jgi:pilus assembly protein Flp/PilA